jgi:hypothetical protein
MFRRTPILPRYAQKEPYVAKKGPFSKRFLEALSRLDSARGRTIVALAAILTILLIACLHAIGTFSESEEISNIVFRPNGSIAAAPLRAVVLFLHGGKTDKSFTETALPRLDEFFFRHYPHYRMRVFHEHASEAEKQEIVAAMPHAQREWAAQWRGAEAYAAYTDVDHVAQLERTHRMAALMEAAGLGFVNTTAWPVSQQASVPQISPAAAAALGALRDWLLLNVVPGAAPRPAAAGGVEFHDVTNFWEKLPHGVSEEQVKYWIKTQRVLQRGRGYRLMCRFWAGIVWQLMYSSAVDDLYTLIQNAAAALDVNMGPVGVDGARAVMRALAAHERMAPHQISSATQLLADALTFGGRRALGGPLVDERGAAGGDVFLTYDYYWRLDTDSVIRSRISVDLFQLVFGRNSEKVGHSSTSHGSMEIEPHKSSPGCIYAFNSIMSDNDVVTEGMYDLFMSFLDVEIARAASGSGPDLVAAARAARQRTHNIITDAIYSDEYHYTQMIRENTSESSSIVSRAVFGPRTTDDEPVVVRVVPPSTAWWRRLHVSFHTWWHGGTRDSWWIPLFYNNFEMGTLAHKQAPMYRRWFDAVDRDNETRGILRYRWGDAPLHTHALFMMENGRTDRMCLLPAGIVDYFHELKPWP